MSDFRKDLENIINRNSAENASNTPDFILAQYLDSCLLAFDTAVQARDGWYAIAPQPGWELKHVEPDGR